MPSYEEAKGRMILQELVRRANTETRRLRELEQRIDAIDTRTKGTENNLIRVTHELQDKLADFDARLKLTEDRLVQEIANLDKVNKQINKLARKRDVEELEKMFELLNPISGQFVTERKLNTELKRLETRLVGFGKQIEIHE